MTMDRHSQPKNQTTTQVRNPSTGSAAPPEPRAPYRAGSSHRIQPPRRSPGPPPQAAARSEGQTAPVHFGRPQGASALGIPSSRKPDVEAKNSGDIGLNGSAKVSNHSNTTTMHEASGDIGLTKAAKESNHSGGYTSTMISALVRWTRPTDLVRW